MWQMLTPRGFVRSVTACDLDSFIGAGIKGVILDIDNTICPWGDPGLAPGVKEWVEEAKRRGLRICLASNAGRGRVEAVARLLGVDAVPGAVKPRRAGYVLALALLGTAPSETVALGDQIFTDILGGNRMGLFTILVEPIARRELVATKFMRFWEGLVLKRLQRTGVFPGWTSPVKLDGRRSREV